MAAKKMKAKAKRKAARKTLPYSGPTCRPPKGRGKKAAKKKK
jgi:hypothetical protein